MNVPSWYSRKAAASSSRVFMTIGPDQATGSPRGLPDASRNRNGTFLAVTSVEPPSVNITGLQVENLTI